MPRHSWYRMSKFAFAWQKDGERSWARVVRHRHRPQTPELQYHWFVMARRQVLEVFPVRLGEGWSRTLSEAKSKANALLRQFERTSR